MEKINLGWVIEQAIAINAPKANCFLRGVDASLIRMRSPAAALRFSTRSAIDREHCLTFCSGVNDLI